MHWWCKFHIWIAMPPINQCTTIGITFKPEYIDSGRPPECSVYWFIKLQYHKFSLLYKEMKIGYINIILWNALFPKVNLFRLNQFFHYVVTFPQASFFVQFAFFSEKVERWLLQCSIFLKFISISCLYLKKKNCFSRACAAWSDLS